MAFSHRSQRRSPLRFDVRYHFEFWPDRQTTQEAIGLASEVRRLVLGTVPQVARP
jgi:hypothetical protein